MCVLGFTKPAFIYAVSNSQSHVGVQSRHGRVYTRPCKSIINLATGTSRYLSTQENPLMYIDVYFRILHAYTIIYSIYLNIGFPIRGLQPACRGGAGAAARGLLSSAGLRPRCGKMFSEENIALTTVHCVYSYCIRTCAHIQAYILVSELPMPIATKLGAWPN